MLKRCFTIILKLLQCNHCQKNFFVLLHFVIVESLYMQISHIIGNFLVCLFVFYVYYYFYFYFFFFFFFFLGGFFIFFFFFYIFFFFFFFLNDIFLFCQIPITSFLGMLKRG